MKPNILYQPKTYDHCLFTSFLVDNNQQKLTTVNLVEEGRKTVMGYIEREARKLGWNVDHIICFYIQKLDGRNKGMVKGYVKFTYGFTYINNIEGKVEYPREY